MRQRTFTCRDCGASVTVPLKTGRPPALCADCSEATYQRRLAKAKAARDAARVANDVCQRPGCVNLIPQGSRADRKWCSSACQSWWHRRTSGAVIENTGVCSSCLEPLTGRQVNATVCTSRKCLSWAARHPGEPHPSTRPRACRQCGESIDHLNARARFCSDTCKNKWLRLSDPQRHNAKARAWQGSEKGKTYKDAYRKANMERYRRLQREARQRNPERYAAYWKQWATANTEAVAEIGRMRRARQKGNPDSIGVPAEEWRKILNRHRGCCAYCGVKPNIIHMDHVVPLAKGGRHAAANVLPACPKCNLTKHAMFLSVWRYRGRRLGAERLIFQ